MRSGGTGARIAGRFVLATLCLLALLLSAPPAWSQNTYTVTTTGDDLGTTPCISTGGSTFSCNTLRDAIVTANGAGGSNTINFAAAVTSVTLSSNLPPINTVANTGLTIDGGTSGSGSVTINSAGFTVFSVTTAGASFENLTVTDALTKADNGELILGAANTYNGATTVDGGTLALSGTGSIATSSGLDLAASGTTFDISGASTTSTIQDLSGVSGSTVSLGANAMIFGTANSTTFAGVFSGDGELIKQGAGTVTLTGNSSGFAGTTIVTGGGLDIAPTTTSGGSLGGSVTLENGGFVEGHGTIGGSLANVDGFVASLGAAIPLTVGGSYSQNAAGTLIVGLSPTAATRLAVTDGAQLSGTLNIQAVQGNAGYVPFTKYLILNAAGGVSGTFSEVDGALPPLPVSVEYLPQEVELVLGGFTGATSNEAAVANALNTAFPNSTGDFATVLDLAVNLPQAEMQQALSSFGGQIYGNLATVSLEDRRLFLGAMDERLRLLNNDSPSAVVGSLGGGIPMAWGGSPNALQIAALGDAINDPVGLAVQGMSSDAAPPPAPAPPPVPIAPPPYSPPPYAPPAALTAAPVGDVINDPVGLAASQIPAAPPVTTSWIPSSGNLWARGFGQFGSIASSGGALGADYTTGGGALGADMVHTARSILGVAVGGGQSNVALNTNPETGTISFVQFGAYGAQAIGDGLVADGAAIYSHDFYDITRGIYLPGADRIATSSHGGNDAVVDVGVSRPYIAGGWEVTPRIGLSYYRIGQSSFSESGAGSLDLAVDPNALNALFSRVGIAVAQPLTLGDTRLVPELRLAWLHDFIDPQSTYNAAFAGTNAASFTQTGVPVGRNAADLGVGLGFALPQTAFPGELSGFLQYEATLATHETANSVTAGVRYKW